MDFDQFEEKIRADPFVSYEQRRRIPSASGVYAAWLAGDSRCFYVGESSDLSSRIDSHFSGNRGSDRFCLYVYDSYVHEERPVGLSTLQVNRLTRSWIRQKVKFNWAEVPASVRKTYEEMLRRKWKPILNPL